MDEASGIEHDGKAEFGNARRMQIVAAPERSETHNFAKASFCAASGVGNHPANKPGVDWNDMEYSWR